MPRERYSLGTDTWALSSPYPPMNLLAELLSTHECAIERCLPPPMKLSIGLPVVVGRLSVAFTTRSACRPYTQIECRMLIEEMLGPVHDTYDAVIKKPRPATATNIIDDQRYLDVAC